MPANWTDPSTPMVWTVSGAAYGNTVQYTDGATYTFSRRERPHLVWAPGKRGVTPVALTNGVEYGAAANTPYQDTVFTLSQPLRQG